MEFVHVELKRDSWCTPRKQIRTPSDAVESILKMIQDMDKEVLMMITLATDGSVINASVCSVGSINQSIVSIVNVLRVAILSGGSGIILIHNHPSGSTSVSHEDREVTRRVAIACNLIGVELLDHIVVGAYGAFCSIKEEYDECFIVRKNDYKSLIISKRGEKNE